MAEMGVLIPSSVASIAIGAQHFPNHELQTRSPLWQRRMMSTLQSAPNRRLPMGARTHLDIWARQRQNGTSTGSVVLHLSPTCTHACFIFDHLRKEGGYADKRISSFQGFDSGIYTIIISDKTFINEFNVSGARAGVVASMSSPFQQFNALCAF
jgi:hypothetical protein